MVSWVVQSLLLSAVFGAVFCDSPEIQIVKNLIATSNKVFRDRNMTEIGLPDIGWVFEPIQYKEGRLGQFDTLELLPDPKIVSSTNHYGTLYTFNVSTALRTLTLKYKFHVKIPLFGKDGIMVVTVDKQSFQAEGRVFVNSDGTCLAILQDAKVAQFGDFKVKFIPDFIPFFTQIYQKILNVVHKQLIPVVNFAIRSEISKSDFREHFNEYVCDEVTRNSRTEAPTTYTPTTDQPEPTTSSSTSDQQSSTTSYRPSSGTSDYPSSGTSYNPSSGTSDYPSSGTSYNPSSGTSDYPSSGTSYYPSSGTSDYPSSGTSNNPSSGTSDYPSSGTSNNPSSGTSDYSYSSTSYNPSSGTSDYPSSGTSDYPSSGTSYNPSSGTSYNPSSGKSDYPSASTSYNPSSGTSDYPSASTSYNPSSGTSYNPSSSAPYNPTRRPFSTTTEETESETTTNEGY